MNTIVITQNYFADLLAAREAGIIKTATNPNKAKLYDLIEDHNLACSKSAVTVAVAVEEKPESEQVNYQDLFQQWQTKKQDKVATKAKGEKAAKSVSDPFLSRGYLNAKEVADLLQKHSFKMVSEMLSKPESYLRRSERAWRIYTTSDVAQRLFENGKISWADIHKVAGGEPSKDWSKVEKKLIAMAGE